MPIPAFRPDGYLPEGLHQATEEEVAARFGQTWVTTGDRSGDGQRKPKLYRPADAQRLVINLELTVSGGEAAADQVVVEVGATALHRHRAGLAGEAFEQFDHVLWPLHQHGAIADQPVAAV